MPEHTESEFKLRGKGDLEIAAVDAALREVGATCRSSDSRRHADLYLDDDRGSLFAAGIGLRLRDGGEGRQLTCKRAGSRSNGLFVRGELDAPWTRGEAPRRAGELAGALRDAIEPFTLARALRAVLRLEVAREVRVLTQDGADLCELAVDSVEAFGNGRAASFQELELEVLADVAGNERLAHQLRDRLRLSFAQNDKPTHAASLLGVEQARVDTRDDAPDAPVGRAIARRMQARMQAMRAAEVGVRADDDAEHLHDMRVAIRRMRSLARAFRELWPEQVSARLLAGLGETGRQLGALRDLDVMLATMPDSVGLLPAQLRGAGARAVDWVREQRALQNERLQRWLRSDERLAHAATLEQDVQAIDLDAPPAQAPLFHAAPRALARAVAGLRKQVSGISDDLPIEPAHRLRLAAKRVRYLGEEFAALPGHRYGKALRAVARVQQAFGVVCDHEVAAERLLGWVHTAAQASADGAWTAAALGALAAGRSIAGQAARVRATEQLERMDRKRTWKQFPADRTA